jgi:type VI secretion system secreted protein VgrG
MLRANSSWFTCRIDSGTPEFEELGVYAFSGVEKVSDGYVFNIELVSRNSNIDITKTLGRDCLLTIADKSRVKRFVHGLIRQMKQLHTANTFTHYMLEIVPRLYFIKNTQDQRIYQHMSVPEIIHHVLKKNMFTGYSYVFHLRETYQQREYCTQYGESDYHFICRIAEEEGIYFYHEHTERGHVLCFSDAEGGPAIPGESILRFYPGSGQPADTAVVSRLELNHRINSDRSTMREWNFTTPALDLTAQQNEPEWEKAPTPRALPMETYQFPHLYQTRDEGERYNKLQLMRQLTFREWITCESDVSRHTPGYTFTLYEHPRADINRSWWITEVRHEGSQPGVLEHEAPDGRGLEYRSSVIAIPDTTRFIPEQNHKKVRIEGLQSAIVTGTNGEEVYCDAYGRVKVQFHWDRLGKHDEYTTCWVRVSDAWAGENFGFIQVPRIGQEVLVEFMEGDPDRPVITGRVYNAGKMPPWELPRQKSLSGIQSREFRGGQRNQLVLDDTQGQVQAQLSSDHGLSQLNLGYITRVRHGKGRDDFRGEGFELRTDNWGTIRAGQGLLISTDARNKAEKYHKDLAEAGTNLQGATAQHEDTARLAQIHNAQDSDEDVNVLAKALHEQTDQIRGYGRQHDELTQPHLVLSSPSGIALTTARSAQLHTGENSTVTTGRHFSVSAGRSFLASALDKVSIFAHKMGIRLFAGQGKVQIQAQSDDLEVIADQVLHLISAKKSVHLTAAEEIILNAGGSYIRVNAAGIEQGTNGRWLVHAASHSMSGPASMQVPKTSLPQGAIRFNDSYIVQDAVTEDPIEKMSYEIILPNGGKTSGVTGKDGVIPLQKDLHPEQLQIRLLGVEDE